MAISMYQTSAPVFVKTLENLAAILDKGAAFAAARKIDPSVLLGYRLAPDMFNLTRQVQIAADHAKRAVARLAGVEAPAYEDNEASFADLKARIDKTIAFIKTLKPGQIDGSEERDITLKVGGSDKTLKGQTYLLHNALPNFFFHTTTAYAILRHCGVDVGKKDFIGEV
ncbi:hypothetical protein GALL_268990 [mine drainage metagenome]|uniref:DUF1993 domain-containing protein n=1 Tax=mine drainage metagenome TaxID=410659 RepID=A0A1J5R5J5_9ZZZZ